MKKLTLFIISFTLFTSILWGQTYLDIDKKHLNYDAVIHKDITTINYGEKDAEMEELQVVTILNRNGFKTFRYPKAFYSTQVKLHTFEVTIYNKLGNEIKKFKTKDATDISYYDNYTFFSDNRVKYIDLKPYKYPLTVKVKTKSTLLDTYLVPSKWYLTDQENVFVENKSLTIHKPSNSIFYIEELLKGEKLTKTITPTKIELQVNNKIAKPLEPLGPPAYAQQPFVYIIPQKFVAGDLNGSFENWNEFGQFYHQLNKERTELDDDTIQEIKTLTNGLSKEETIQQLYKRMQEKTRYVSVQFGIGGWQTYPAQFVEKNAYGDCKALSNYMKAMLDVVDIPSNQVLIKAGKEYYQEDLSTTFAHSPFNHVILAVPNNKETIWLECTSQTNPYNYLGSFTMDRKGLFINDDGESYLIETPKSTSSQNKSNYNYNIELNNDSSAFIKIQYEATGLPAEYLYDIETNLTEKELKEELRDYFNLKNSTIEHYSIQPTPNVMSVKVEIEAKATNFMKKSGQRFFLSPFFMLNANNTLDSERLFDIYIKSSHQKQITVQYNFPENIQMENYNQNKTNIENSFGQLLTQTNLDENKITYTYTTTKQGGQFPKEKVDEYNQLIKANNQARKEMIVLLQSN